MLPPPIPRQLQEGILFESSKQLLRWGCTREEAWKVSGASQYLPDGDTRIKWEDHLFGLPCGLLAYLPGESQLDFVTVWLRVPENRYPQGALYEYCQLFDRLVGDFGTPYIKPAVGNACRRKP